MLGSGDNPFVTFGSAHVGAIAIIVAAAVALSLWARRARSPKVTLAIRWAIALGLPANEAVYYVYVLLHDGWHTFVTASLPLHICGAAVYLTAWTLWRRNQYTYELAWFWGLGGTLQAILTPNLAVGLPDYRFIQFFLTHGGIVIGATFATFAMGMRPRRGAILRVVVLTNLLMGVVAGLDWLLGANYMFLCRPPRGASPFFFLPWPWYILFLEAVGVVFVTLLYLPFVPAQRRRRRLHLQLSGPARLADGCEVRLRPLEPDDAAILGRYFLGLGKRTRAVYAPHPFDEPTAARLCATLDDSREIRFLATTGTGRGEQVVGYFILGLAPSAGDLGRYARRGMTWPAGTVCTIAPSVADAWQGRGLGSAMMLHALDAARRLGRSVAILQGGVMVENRPAIGFYRKHGFLEVGRFRTQVDNFDMVRDPGADPSAEAQLPPSDG